jgi:signal peptide peptidase SppA
MEHTRILEWIFTHNWAMYRPALTAMIGIVEEVIKDPVAIAQAFHGQNASQYLDENGKGIQAINPISLTRLDGSYNVRVVETVAVITVSGVIFPRNTSVPSSYGAHTVLDRLGHDFDVALQSKSIKSIIMVYDTPGGEVTGISEMAEAISKGNKVKPIISYVYGMAASAGYFLAAPGKKIIASNTAQVGSIGVVSEYVDTSVADEKKGISRVQIVSNVSPNKRPDLTTPEGRAGIQKLVDDLASVFVSSIANYRNIKFEQVLTEFGQGGMLLAQQALDVGMIDRISTLDQVVAEQIENNDSINFNAGGIGMNAVELKENHPETYKKVFGDGKIEGIVDGEKSGITSENARIAAIEVIKAPGHEDIIAKNKMDITMTAEKISAIILQAQEEKRVAAAGAIVDDAVEVNNRGKGITQDSDEDVQAEEAAVVKNMVDGSK